MKMFVTILTTHNLLPLNIQNYNRTRMKFLENNEHDWYKYIDIQMNKYESYFIENIFNTRFEDKKEPTICNRNI